MDAVALASVIGSTLVGIAGVTAAFLTSKAERAARRDEANAAREHERKLAQRGRLFESQAETYVELLVYVGRRATQVEETHPMITYRPLEGGPEEEQPATPPSAEERHALEESIRNLEARVNAYGSREVVDLTETYLQQTNDFFFTAGAYELTRQQRAAPEQMRQATEEMLAARETCRATYRTIRARINAELAAP